MATKTFKIGLSDADKTNMAQEVYERLIGMCFDEYDSTKTYNEGDFVVYENPADTFKLYKCNDDNVTGTWNSAKWDLATFQDLVDDVEGAVASVADKASVNGNYPTMTVGLADNLTPYGEDSGAEQDNPFISNGTGTNNNTEIVTVGDYGLLKEKQGNTLAVNQLAQYTSSYIPTSAGNITFTGVDNKYVKLGGTAQGDVQKTGWFGLNAGTFKTGKTYLIFSTKISGSLTGTVEINLKGTHALGEYYVVTTATETDALTLKIYDESVCSDLVIFIACIDLTQMFNGDIPQDLLDNPSHFSWYYNGVLTYNAGELKNADGKYLVCTKRNIWDEEWEVGAYDTTTGEKDNATTSQIRCKNRILVVPNRTYYSFCGTFDGYLKPLFYDKSDNYIGTVSSVYNSTFTTPSNCCYVRFYMNLTYGTTYKNDITVSLYYTPEEGGEGYDKYYPYEEPYEVDTGNEVLRKAGSVKDYKEPNGTIHRLVGSVDLGTLEWEYRSIAGSRYGFAASVSGLKYQSNYALLAKLLCGKYENSSLSSLIDNSSTKIGICTSNTASNIFVFDNNYNDAATFKTAMNGVYLYYELATPTTEQGTPFAENLPINDYGMLYWLDSSNNLVGIPQGAKIFYPVNYKGFIDDMYMKVEGDSSKFVIDTELSAKFETYLKSLSGYDGTATQVLKNVEGTLTWITEGE